MHTTKEDIIEQLREGLRNYEHYHKSDGRDSPIDTIDLSGLTTSGPTGAWDPYYGAVPPNVTISSGTYNLTNAGPNIYVSDDFVSPSSGRITLKGEDADIDINGVSLTETLRTIQERLNILQPNPELEQEWDQLRALGEQYRRLEQELTEKSQAWKTLKS